jgi:hypothetical protein
MSPETASRLIEALVFFLIAVAAIAVVRCTVLA